MPGFLKNSLSPTSNRTDLNKLIFESSPDCVKILDLEGNLLSMNRNGQCAMEIDNFANVCGAPWLSLWPEESHEVMYAALKAASNGSIGRFEAFCPTAKGTPKWWDVTVSPILGSDGRVEQFLSVSRDVTVLYQAKEELRASEERLRFALDAAVMAAWDWNLTTGESTRFDISEDIIGLRSGSAADFFELIHPRDRDRILQSVDRAKNGEIPYDFEFRITTPDGRILWLSDKARLRTNPADGRLHLTGVVMNVTERKIAEERLRLLDTVGEATRLASDAQAIMAETTRLIGEHLDVTRCAYADVEIDNNQFTIRDDWTAEGAISSVGVYSLNLFGPRAAADMRYGRTLVIRDVERELSSSEGADMFNAIGIKAIICCPLVKEGRLVAMMAIHHDSSRNWTVDEIALVKELADRSWAHIERVRATEALRKSEAHLSSVFEQTAAGIAEIDIQGILIRANERYCQILGRSHEEIVGQHLHTLIHPDDLEENVRLLEKLMEDGEPFEIDNRYLLPNGEPVWVSKAVAAIRGIDSKPASILAVVLDVTDRKQVEEELRNANRRKDEFLAMLAHELRNPLAPINTAAEVLKLARLDENRIRQTSNIITRQVAHMTELIDDLLDVSRVTRGLVTLQEETLNLKTIVADAIEQVHALINAKDHQLEMHVPDEGVFVKGDKTRLTQVLANVVGNAAKYTLERGRIAVSIEMQGKDVQVVVKDNGIGIEPGLLPHVFDLFSQAKRTPDRSQGGLGLGLALVKSLVELHGGTVAAYSEGLGKGSAFILRLPKEVANVEEQNHLSTDSGLAIASDALCILVVDDNTDAANTLSMLLKALGHQVVVEHSASQALKRVSNVAPKLLFLDIGLPDMDGYELARRIRAMPETMHSVLIAITGYGQKEDKEHARLAGFDHHLTKPVRLDALTALIKSISLSGKLSRNG
jgi:PAS domain S-box-containing protein